MNDANPSLKIYTIDDYPQLQEFNRKEILRYAGFLNSRSQDPAVSIDTEPMMKIMEQCIQEVRNVLTYKVSYRRNEVKWVNDEPQLCFDYGKSENLAYNLRGCTETVIFAATIGIGMDRLIARYSRISPVKGLFMQAVGAERIECLCDLFNQEVTDEAKDRGCVTKPRYSPGYGDLKLQVQPQLMELLDCSKRIGINLNESLLMSPSKSVTAIIGIAPEYK